MFIIITKKKKKKKRKSATSPDTSPVCKWDPNFVVQELNFSATACIFFYKKQELFKKNMEFKTWQDDKSYKVMKRRRKMQNSKTVEV